MGQNDEYPVTDRHLAIFGNIYTSQSRSGSEQECKENKCQSEALQTSAETSREAVIDEQESADAKYANPD